MIPRNNLEWPFLYWIKWTFNQKLSKNGKEEHFILFKGKIYQDELLILNIYAPDASTLTFIKKHY